MRIAVGTALVTATLVLFPAWASSKAYQAMADRLDAFQSYMESIDKPYKLVASRALSARFADTFLEVDAEMLASLSDSELRAFFDIADAVAFYSVRSENADKLHAIYKELSRRGLATTSDSRAVQGTFLATRNFESARAFSMTVANEQHQDVPDVKNSTGKKPGPRLMVIGEDGLTVERAHIDQGKRIVVIAHPFCHFSNAAMRAIENEPELKAAFKNSYWLSAQDRQLALDALRQWNSAADVTRLNIIYDQWEWPLPDASTTPTFYFLDDGQIVATVEGWPKEGNRKKLYAALRELYGAGAEP